MHTNFCWRKPVCRTRLVEAAVNLHSLSQAVRNGALASCLALSESCGSAKGTGSSAVLNTNNADVLSILHFTLASHTLRHLDLEGEVGVGSEGKTLNTKAGNVLGDLSVLESASIFAPRLGVDSGGQRTSTILVDLQRR